MKLKIVFGSVLAIGMLMMLPSISALNYSQAEEIISSNQIVNTNSNFSEILLRYKNDPNQPTFIILFLLSVIINLLRFVKISSLFVVILILIIMRITKNNSTAIID